MLSKREKRVETDLGEMVVSEVRTDGDHPVHDIAQVAMTLISQMLAEQGMAIASAGMEMQMFDDVPGLSANGWVMRFHVYFTDGLNDEDVKAMGRYGCKDMRERVVVPVDSEDKAEIEALLDRAAEGDEV